MIESEREIAELRDVKVSKEKLKKADYQVCPSCPLLCPSFVTDHPYIYSLQKRLENAGYEDEKELDQRIKKIDEYLKRTRKKDVGDLEEPVEEPSFPLIDRPDAELTEEEIKEKRKQKLYKAGYDARMKIKAEKAAEKAHQVRSLPLLSSTIVSDLLTSSDLVGGAGTQGRGRAFDGPGRLGGKAARGARGNDPTLDREEAQEERARGQEVGRCAEPDEEYRRLGSRGRRGSQEEEERQ